MRPSRNNNGGGIEDREECLSRRNHLTNQHVVRYKSLSKIVKNFYKQITYKKLLYCTRQICFEIFQIILNNKYSLQLLSKVDSFRDILI